MTKQGGQSGWVNIKTLRFTCVIDEAPGPQAARILAA